ncbi:MAG: hypothetical protein GKR89_19295 [Candidatus Latescibacteria bacterium]|nr:hypothetical protein [Candidatus Latescibacterota bacterium]
MKITVTGPRSAGKSTVSRILANKLGLEYIDGDAEVDKAVQDLGGLYQAMNDRRVDELMERAVALLEKFFERDDFVLDLAGGATIPGQSEDKAKHAEKIRAIIKDSTVVLLLPNALEETAIKILQKREIRREHFVKMQESGLITAAQIKERTSNSYAANLPAWCSIADVVIYCDDKSPDAIADEIGAIAKA